MCDRDVVLPQDMLNCPRCSGPADPATFDAAAVSFFCTKQIFRLVSIASRPPMLCREVMAEFRVSRATAKRDLAAVRRFRRARA